MAKPEPPARARTASSGAASRLDGLYLALKVVAIAVGLPGTLLSLMAIVGLVTSSGVAQVIVALLVGVGGPLFVADRFLSDDPSKRARGLVTDVVAVSWLGFLVLFTGALNGATRGALASEGDELTKSGYETLGSVTYFLAGVSVSRATLPSANAPASASASSAASVAASASANPADGGR